MLNMIETIKEHFKGHDVAKQAAKEKASLTNLIASDAILILHKGTDGDKTTLASLVAKEGEYNRFKGVVSQARRVLKGLKENEQISVNEDILTLAMLDKAPYGEELPVKINSFYRALSKADKDAQSSVADAKADEKAALALFCEANQEEVKDFLARSTITEIAAAIGQGSAMLAEQRQAEQEAEKLANIGKLADDTEFNIRLLAQENPEALPVLLDVLLSLIPAQKQAQAPKKGKAA